MVDPVEQLGRMVLENAAKERDAIGDSDLDDEQSASVTVHTTLGLLRDAGLRSVPAYHPDAARERRMGHTAHEPAADVAWEAHRPIGEASEHYATQLSAAQTLQGTTNAFDVALEALARIAMEDVDPAWQEAMSALRQVNGIMCGDGSRMYRVPSVQAQAAEQ